MKILSLFTQSVHIVLQTSMTFCILILDMTVQCPKTVKKRDSEY